MLYQDLIKSSVCPFCPEAHNEKQIILKKSGASLWMNKAPYIRDHLLIVPTRHVLDFEDLNANELKVINKLIFTAIQLLKKRGHKAYSILARQGAKSGRSVKHIHIHVIPDLIVTNREHASIKRVLITESAGTRIIKTYKKLLGL